jgi:ATP-binding protein involved in chromosome partitioning
MQPLMERISGALAAVRNPRTGADVMAAEQVRDIATTVDGKVRLTLLLAPEDDATLVRSRHSTVLPMCASTSVTRPRANPHRRVARPLLP